MESGAGGQEETESMQQDGGDTSEVEVEDCGASEPPTQQNPAEPEVNQRSAAESQPDHTDETTSETTNIEQYNVTLGDVFASLLNIRGTNISEDIENQELQPEEEEAEDNEDFIVLSAEHPLVKRQQAALNIQLSKELERINLALSEKLEQDKAFKKCRNDLLGETYKIQRQLRGLEIKMDDLDHIKAQTEAKRHQAQDQLEETKSQFSSCASQEGRVKSNVSQLQAEIDNLMQQIIYTQEVSDDLRSNVKAMKNVRCKAITERNQAQEQKAQQDLYAKRLTKDMEMLTQQISMYEVQIRAQADETSTAKEALSEAEMNIDSLALAQKKLLQQWRSTLVGMGKRDEAFGAMQEALRTLHNQVDLLDREIEACKKFTTEEQEKNETLTMQLNWSQMEGATSKKLIGQKQAKQQDLQTHYSTCLRTLRETESRLARLSKESSSIQTEVNEQKRQLEKESAMRLDLEDKIMTHMQEKLTHNKAAQHTQKLTSKLAALKKEKVSQLWHLESDIASARLEGSKVCQHLDSLAVTQEDLDKEIAIYNKTLTSDQAKLTSTVVLIGQKQNAIVNYHKKIHEITARTGHEDLSPLHIKLQAIMTQTDELAANIKRDQQLWMKRQETLVELAQAIEANRKSMQKLEAQYIVLQQKKMRFDNQIEAEQREEKELERTAKMLRGDLVKLNTLLSKNGQLSLVLEQQNALMETDFLHRLKEAERQSIEMEMKHEKTQEEKERLLNSLVEAERQIMLWEKKTLLVKETRAAVDTEVGRGEIQTMKAEIHRMEVRLSQLMKHQERLLRESEATVARRETIVLRKEAMVQSSHKQTVKGELSRTIQLLQRKIQDTHKLVAECEQALRQLQETQDGLGDRLKQQRLQLIDLCGTSYSLDPDFAHLQDTKEKNLARLVALQSRTKRLQGVCEGRYQASSTSETIATALQSQMERVHAASTILHRVCEEFPQHQGALRRLSLALATRSHTLEQETS